MHQVLNPLPKMSPKDKGNKPKYPNPFSPIRGNFLLPSPGSSPTAASASANTSADVSSMSWTYHQQQVSEGITLFDLKDIVNLDHD